MLRLKNVSKYYYNKGMISSGFNKVSLNFNIGEFVAITGESGSGKSTLLNVLAGLDSYEDGEMYINDKETSHYSEKDYEIYRRKYIGNIFQNFNLVNSYTVYQNIELVLLLNGYKKKEVKEKILNIIKDVDLTKYKNTKVSKLSGGQKQRVAIARALAKDTPIILADEPTGNLDKKSSESVIELLSKISKDKLVIVVTHNYEQIEKYVTRKITMHDGKVIEDKKINSYTEVTEVKESKYNNITGINKLLLSFRNTFNIIQKFLLMFFVFFSMVVFFAAAYAAFKEDEYNTSNEGYNNYFNNTSDKRIVIKKKDLTSFTDEEYDKIIKINNVDKIVKNDYVLDFDTGLSSNEIYFYGNTVNIEELKEKVIVGRLPEKDNEVVIAGKEGSYYFNDEKHEDILTQDFTIEYLTDWSRNQRYNVKIVGIVYENSYNNKIYMNETLLNKLGDKFVKERTTLNYTFAGTKYNSYYMSIYGEVVPNNKVPKGKYVIPEEMTYNCTDLKCKKYNLLVEVNNVYFKDSKTLTYHNYYNSKNITKLLGVPFDTNNGSIFINNEDYNNLFNKGYFQSSVFIKDVKYKDTVINKLNSMGYKTLYIKDTLANRDGDDLALIRIFKVIVLSVLLIVLFFISYFVIKLILKSRNVYFATLRILGATSKIVKQLLNLELYIIYSIGYIVFLTLSLLIKYDILVLTRIKETINYLTIFDYIFIFVLLFIMSKLISNRYSRKLFNTSAMNAYREEI